MFSLRKYKGKQLVSYLRNGDYAHAGESEAIDLVMHPFQKRQNQHILDAGCGLGGTAQYIHENGWGKVTGIDIEPESIAYAKDHYSINQFFTCDVTATADLFKDAKFDIICLFNSFYAFQDQKSALTSLSKISAQKGQLAIFDYSTSSPLNTSLFYSTGTFSTETFKPVMVYEIEQLLNSANWSLLSIVDITTQYVSWYKTLLMQLETEKNHIIKIFGEAAFDKAKKTYSEIFQDLFDRVLGGCIVYAEKQS